MTEKRKSSNKTYLEREYAEISRTIAFTIALLGGMIGGVILVLPAQSLLLPKISFLPLAVLVVGVTEESFKPIGLIVVTKKHRSWISSKRDYLLAGVLAGMGFGVLENLVYYFKFGAEVMVARVGVGLPLHAGMTAFVGVGLYFAVEERNYFKLAWLLAFAILIHAIYDYLYLVST